MAGRNKFLCLDCGVDTGKLGEHYFVNTELWLSVVGSAKGMLCIVCLENRLGRKLVASDFTNCYINNIKHGTKSVRFIDRLSSEH